MEQKSMTAWISAFSRAYHRENNGVKIFDDSVARLLFTDEEYSGISKTMAGGIAFFNPAFAGAQESALRWVVDNQLSPAVLGRAAFAEKALQTAVSIGAGQYLILGAGYDTFAYRQPTWADRLQIFEVDHPATAADKRKRLEQAGVVVPNNVHFIAADFTQGQWQRALTQNAAFDGGKTTFCSILGVVYYLSRQTFETLISTLGHVLPSNSSLVLDYPDENSNTQRAGHRAQKQTLLAAGAGERMLANYSYQDLEKILSDHGFLIFEHLTPAEMTRLYFEPYNRANPQHPMAALDNTSYCLAVKKQI